MSIYCIDENNNKMMDSFDADKDDPSLNGQRSSPLRTVYRTNKDLFNHLFFSDYNLKYITDYFHANNKEIRVVSYPYDTTTCYEKGIILDGWNPLNIIKALYLEYSIDQSLFAIVIPETGCFIDKKQIREKLNIPDDGYLFTTKDLPKNMSYGTCSPLIVSEDLIQNGGRVKRIIFDQETLIMKKHDTTLDDFSFGLNHRLSVQMNYYHCYKMLKQKYGNIVADEEILTLSFKEKFVRKNGKIKINYEFNTINYRTANFINSIHGYGDVSIVNDHVDELDLPEVLTASNNKF